MRSLKILCLTAFCLCLGIQALPVAAQPGSATYYVSSSQGNDSNSGLSESSPFATIARVNALSLLPGDRVLLRCGDTWHAEQLILSESGTESDPIVFGSYPQGCADKPVLSGSRPIGGWAPDAGNVYRADLPAGEFPLGINQLFRDGERLRLGRWPNLDAPDAGYTFVDAHSAGSNQITDNELPALDWSGAIVHIKNIRWSMLSRQVTASSGATLTLNEGLSCLVSGWADCEGWGYFINNHRSTLDQDGEWYYDPAARRVYLYSASGLPDGIEGSVVLEEGETLRQGGIMLSDGSATAYVDPGEPAGGELVQPRHRHTGRHERRYLPPHHRAQPDRAGCGRGRCQPEQLAGAPLRRAQGPARRAPPAVRGQPDRGRQRFRHHRLLRRVRPSRTTPSGISP